MGTTASAPASPDELLLSAREIERLTGYRRSGDQVRELHLQGFHRARRNRLGEVILERDHYQAVCAGARSAGAGDDRPPILPILPSPPRGRAA